MVFNEKPFLRLSPLSQERKGVFLGLSGFLLTKQEEPCLPPDFLGVKLLWFKPMSSRLPKPVFSQMLVPVVPPREVLHEPLSDT
jgi:hypothetical protein